MLLANEEFQKKTGGYESESLEDKVDDQKHKIQVGSLLERLLFTYMCISCYSRLMILKEEEV